MKKILLFLISSFLILAGVFWFVAQEKINYQTELNLIRIGSAELKVEIADSQGERGQGLGGRKSLPENQGMLFVFEKPARYPFWMRAMNFPLDIIWLDADYQIVDLAARVEPSSYPNAFVPNQEALYVLEVNADWAEKNNIKIGSRAVFLWQSPEDTEKKKILLDYLNTPIK